VHDSDLVNPPQYHFIDVALTAIRSVVGMVPHRVQLQEGGMQDRFFLVQKMGMELAYTRTEYDDNQDN